MNVPDELIWGTHSFTIRVVESLQLNDIWVSNDAHNLQLTVLNQISQQRTICESGSMAHLESLVLQDALDGGILARR